MYVTAINDALSWKDAFLTVLQNNITTVLSRKNDQVLTNIDNRLEELQTQLLKLASSKADYEDVAEEIYLLRKQKQRAYMENTGRDEQRKWIADMSVFLQEQPISITEYDKQLVRQLIEKAPSIMKKSALYRHIAVKANQENFGVQMLPGLLSEIENDPKYAFLHSNEKFQQLKLSISSQLPYHYCFLLKGISNSI